jgi:hypothetical protein
MLDVSTCIVRKFPLSGVTILCHHPGVAARSVAAPWPYNQILPFDRSDYTTVFRLAALVPAWRRRAPEFEAVAEQQPGFRTDRIALTYPLTTQAAL